MTMARTSPPAARTTDPSGLLAGVAGGLAGGIVFGALMHLMDMMGMIAMLIGAESVAVGWLAHLGISAFIGATYALIFGRQAGKLGTSAALGMGYGALWWVLGAMLIMPARLGMELFMFNPMTRQSLMGHLIYGLLLGLVYALVRLRLHGATS